MGPSQAHQFLTIVKYMNMTRAAEELYITQSALSQSLGRLENELGVRLFYRDGNHLILSREGEQLVSYFREFMSSYEGLLDKAREVSTPQIPQVRIGFCGSGIRFSAFFMTDFFEQAHTGFKNILLYADPEGMREMLLTGQVDLAISYAQLATAQISSIKLTSSEIFLVVPAQHELASRDDVSLSELQPYEFIGFIASAPARQSFDRACAECGFEVRYAYELGYHSYYHAVWANAGKGRYLFYSPEDCLDAVYFEGFKKVRIKGKHISQDAYLCWATESKANLTFKNALDYIIAQYPHQDVYHAGFSHGLSRGFRDQELEKQYAKTIYHYE